MVEPTRLLSRPVSPANGRTVLDPVEPESRDPSLPPHNHDAERTVLGSILIDPASIASVDFLSSDDFHHPSHARIFASMRSLDADRIPVDLGTVADRLEQLGTLTDAGGRLYLAKLLDQT